MKCADLIIPATKGTLGMLESAKKHGCAADRPIYFTIAHAHTPRSDLRMSCQILRKAYRRYLIVRLGPQAVRDARRMGRDLVERARDRGGKGEGRQRASDLDLPCFQDARGERCAECDAVLVNSCLTDRRGAACSCLGLLREEQDERGVGPRCAQPSICESFLLYLSLSSTP